MEKCIRLGYVSKDKKYSLKGIVGLHPDHIIAHRDDVGKCRIVPVKNVMGITITVHDVFTGEPYEKIPDYLTYMEKTE